MNTQSKVETDLTVRSFAYVAKKLAGSSQYEQILSEAEKHRSALRLALRDTFEMAEQALRKQSLTKAEVQQLRENSSKAVAQAQQAISRIAAQYAPQRLAA